MQNNRVHAAPLLVGTFLKFPVWFHNKEKKKKQSSVSKTKCKWNSCIWFSIKCSSNLNFKHFSTTIDYALDLQIRKDAHISEICNVIQQQRQKQQESSLSNGHLKTKGRLPTYWTPTYLLQNMKCNLIAIPQHESIQYAGLRHAFKILQRHGSMDKRVFFWHLATTLVDAHNMFAEHHQKTKKIRNLLHPGWRKPCNNPK